MDINSIIEMIEKLKKDSVVCNHNPCVHLDLGDIIEHLRKMSDGKDISSEAKRRTKITAGFSTYQWMVDNIEKHGRILTQDELRNKELAT